MDASLVHKLGIKEGHLVYLVKAPAEFCHFLKSTVPASCCVVEHLAADEAPDVLIVWLSPQQDLSGCFHSYRHSIKANGAIWAVIPKKSGRRGRDGPTFDAVQRAALPLGLVDNKDLSFNQDEYGVRLVIRKELR